MIWLKGVFIFAIGDTFYDQQMKQTQFDEKEREEQKSEKNAAGGDTALQQLTLVTIHLQLIEKER